MPATSSPLYKLQPLRMLRLVLSFLLAPRVFSGGPAAPEYGAANDIAACDVALGAGTCGQDTVEGIQPYDGADAGDVAAVRTTLLQKRTPCQTAVTQF